MQNDKERFKNEFKKRLYDFVLRLIKFLDTLPKDTITQVMVKQLIRSGTSIIANYIEARASSSRKDFTNFFTHALKSANESKVWLALLRDTNRASKEEIEWLLHELEELSKILAASILKLKNKK